MREADQKICYYSFKSSTESCHVVFTTYLLASLLPVEENNLAIPSLNGQASAQAVVAAAAQAVVIVTH